MARPPSAVAAVTALARSVSGMSEWSTDALTVERSRGLRVAGQRWELRVSLEWHMDDLTAWFRVGRDQAARLEGRAQSALRPAERRALDAWDQRLAGAGYFRIGDGALDGGGSLTFCKNLRPADVELERAWLDRVMKLGTAGPRVRSGKR